MKLFYSSDYVRAEYAFDTTRKARWVAESLQAEPVAGVEFVAPEPVTEALLCEMHDPAYVAAVRTGAPRALAESQGFAWDALLWPSVCASTGGVLAAADAALREGCAGSLSSGLHHARRDQGQGYCTFNGLALAAYHALAEWRWLGPHPRPGRPLRRRDALAGGAGATHSPCRYRRRSIR